MKVDHGRPFDWGKASPEYARYRDIYPPTFFEPLVSRGLFAAGRQVLDLGTGTGAVPRLLAAQGCGARFTGVDASPGQIEEARALAAAAGLDIDFRVCPAEAIDFPENTFDAATACQCYVYFDEAALLPRLVHQLKPGGFLAVMTLMWLPFEDPIAGATEALVRRFNPDWTGHSWQRRPFAPSPAQLETFTVEDYFSFDVAVPFTRESWNGRILACRGVGPSLPPHETAAFSQEHLALLEKEAPPHFEVKHQAIIGLLRAR